MSLLDGITKDHLVRAMEDIDQNGFRIGISTNILRWFIYHNKKLYPPKYTVWLASKFANGKEVQYSAILSGKQVNSLIREKGFDIVEKETNVLLYQADVPVAGGLVFSEWALEETARRDKRCFYDKESKSLYIKFKSQDLKGRTMTEKTTTKPAVVITADEIRIKILEAEGLFGSEINFLLGGQIVHSTSREINEKKINNCLYRAKRTAEKIAGKKLVHSGYDGDWKLYYEKGTKVTKPAPVTDTAPALKPEAAPEPKPEKQSPVKDVKSSVVEPPVEKGKEKVMVIVPDETEA